MDATELREMSSEEIEKKLLGLYQEAFNLRFRHATAQLENSSEIRKVRRDIARIKTIVGEKTRSAGKEI
ncbi:MAG: 50S ribosomal protein L29 [Magnetococcales bacterium]|nr:50S ribosomal protein L29 [Magnetococcales bacterium]MBF0149941.1 50S ribosomal protein L29 [Magnetococcales bacterium]MBF0172890.1 50S ribosomal protein L29 [Magnetococcales bacterium]MBF0346715.1 50S ribosomal protein L29 [Magnetococcales bacterium]MBF0630403.1 50S ribosomal protein L29 [Magnetococcales bacterium]